MKGPPEHPPSYSFCDPPKYVILNRFLNINPPNNEIQISLSTTWVLVDLTHDFALG
jgi:hypothetical protein